MKIFISALSLLLGEFLGFTFYWYIPWWLVVVVALGVCGYVRRSGYVFILALGFVLAVWCEERVFTKPPWTLTVLDQPQMALCGVRRVRVEFPDSIPAPQVGDKLLVNGNWRKVANSNSRFGTTTLKVTSAQFIGRDEIRVKWARVAKACAERVGLGLEWVPELADLNRAILLGKRDTFTRLQRLIFVDAGTIHVFAISGLHVMVVAWFLSSLLKGFRGANLVVIPCLWGYVVLTGMSPSAVRAAFMATFCLVAPLVGRRSNLLVAWSWTALLVYGFSPNLIFNVGCTFSFTIMLGIALCLQLGRISGWWIGLVAWLAGVPISAHVFGFITLGSLLANVVVVTCAEKVVKCGVLGLLGGCLATPFAVIMNNIAAIYTWIMYTTSKCVARIPWTVITVKPWSLWVCAMWYVVMGIIFVIAFYVKRRYKVRKLEFI